MLIASPALILKARTSQRVNKDTIRTGIIVAVPFQLRLAAECRPTLTQSPGIWDPVASPSSATPTACSSLRTIRQWGGRFPNSHSCSLSACLPVDVRAKHYRENAKRVWNLAEKCTPHAPREVRASLSIFFTVGTRFSITAAESPVGESCIASGNPGADEGCPGPHAEREEYGSWPRSGLTISTRASSS